MSYYNQIRYEATCASQANQDFYKQTKTSIVKHPTKLRTLQEVVDEQRVIYAKFQEYGLNYNTTNTLDRSPLPIAKL